MDRDYKDESLRVQTPIITCFQSVFKHRRYVKDKNNQKLTIFMNQARQTVTHGNSIGLRVAKHALNAL